MKYYLSIIRKVCIKDVYLREKGLEDILSIGEFNT